MKVKSIKNYILWCIIFFENENYFFLYYLLFLVTE